MLLIDSNMIESASPHDVDLIEPLLANRVIRRQPRKSIYDAAADSAPLHVRLLKRGIDLIAPHKIKSSQTANSRRTNVQEMPQTMEGLTIHQLAPELQATGNKV